MAYAEGGSGGSPPKNFGFSGLKMRGFEVSKHLIPNVFSRLMLPVVVAQSCYSFTPAVCAFLQAPPLQGRKLVIGWKSVLRGSKGTPGCRALEKKLSTIFIVLVTKIANCFIIIGSAEALPIIGSAEALPILCVRYIW